MHELPSPVTRGQKSLIRSAEWLEFFKHPSETRGDTKRPRCRVKPGHGHRGRGALPAAPALPGPGRGRNPCGRRGRSGGARRCGRGERGRDGTGTSEPSARRFPFFYFDRQKPQTSPRWEIGRLMKMPREPAARRRPGAAKDRGQSSGCSPRPAPPRRREHPPLPPHRDRPRRPATPPPRRPLARRASGRSPKAGPCGGAPLYEAVSPSRSRPGGGAGGRPLSANFAPSLGRGVKASRPRRG